MPKGELTIAEARAIAERREARRDGMREAYEETRSLSSGSATPVSWKSRHVGTRRQRPRQATHQV